MLSTMRAAYLRIFQGATLSRCLPCVLIGVLGTGVVHAQTLQFPPASPAPRPVQASPPPTAAAEAAQPAAALPDDPARPNSAQPLPPTRHAPGPTPGPASIPGEPALGWSPTPTPALGAPSFAAWPPAVLPYREGIPTPQGYRLDSRINGGLVYGGLSIFGVPYVAGLVAAAASGFSKGSGWLALPIIGPFLAMGGRDLNECDFITVSSSASSPGLNPAEEQAQCRRVVVREARILGVFALDGLIQATGSVLTIAGLLSPRETLVRSDIFPPDVKVGFDAGYFRGQLRLQMRMQF